MTTRLFAAAVVALLTLQPASAGETLTGRYVEARTCDVWTGACFANAEMNLTGKHAVLAWHITAGTQDGVNLDGLSVVAVVEASDTLGLKQTGAAKAVVLVDARADTAQRAALVKAAQRLGGELVANVVAVEPQAIRIATDCCKEGGCARVEAGVARITTRCFHEKEDKACGHEANFYPPLARGLKVESAYVTENAYEGQGFGKTWNDSMRRGAYLGTFTVAE